MHDRRWLRIGARSIAIIAWLVVIGVMLRVLSGGGTWTGVAYVLGTESPVTLAFVATALVVAGASLVALARYRPGTWSFAWKGALVALVSSVALLIADHESAVIAVAAAATSLVVAGAMATSMRRAE